MDSITQAALGAAIGEAALGKKLGNKGALLGAVVATLPDLDVVLYLFYNKFEMLSIHRGFSHSILFSLIAAFIIAFILKQIKWTKNEHYLKLWILSWLALFTHIILDTFTSYDTQLLLPFSDSRIGFDSINVIDPIYTLPLLIGLIFSLSIFKNKSTRSFPNYIGLGLSTAYLLCTLGVKQQINMQFQKELVEQNIDFKSILTMPIGIANINWFGVAKTDNGIYMKKYSIIENFNQSLEYFPINDHLLNKANPIAAKKMRWFAKGFYTVVEEGDKIRIYNLQVDMRGIIEVGDKKAPTVGYFEIIPNDNGDFIFSSGTHAENKN